MSVMRAEASGERAGRGGDSHRGLSPAAWRRLDSAAGLLLGLFLVSKAIGRHSARTLISGGTVADVRSVHVVAGVVAAVAVGASVATRRAFPLPALVAATAGTSPLILLGFQDDQFLGVGLVLYVVASTRPPAFSLAALTAVGGIMAAAIGITAAPGTTATSAGPLRLSAIQDFTELAATPAAVLIVAWALGFAAWRQRSYVTAIRHAADERVRVQHELAWRNVTEEKLRIARELHDVVAHGVSVMTVQAAVGCHVMDSRPDHARDALAAIETTGREALDEMRRLLDILRAEGQSADRTPTPRLADLDDLVRRTGRAGVAVELRIVGEARPPLPAGVELSAYRIVQEALTNVVKHAGTDRCRVTLNYAADALAIDVTDDGVGRARPRATEAAGPEQGGHGTIGMRERATLQGGTFEAGPLPIRGYRVAVRLPTGRATA